MKNQPLIENASEKKINNENLTTNFSKTLMNVLKGNIGVGVLALPYAVSQAGSLLGPAIIVLVGLINFHNMTILCEANAVLVKSYKKISLGLAGTVKYSLKPYFSEKVVKYIPYFFNGFIIFYLGASCAVCITASSEVFHMLTHGHLGDIRIWTCILMVPIICLSAISKIGIISIFSGCSNVLCLLGLSVVLIHALPNIKSPSSFPYVSNPATLPNCINTVVFAYEGMSTLLPIVNAIDDKNKIPRLLMVSNAIITVTYVLIGWFVYLAYGGETRTQILLNLPFNIFYNCIKVAYAVGLALSFLVVIYCILTIVLPYIFKVYSFSKIEQIFLQFGLKFVLITLGVSLAVFIPWFGDLLNLIGAFFSIPISFIVPPAVHILTSAKFETNRKKQRIQMIQNMFIIIIGFILTGIGIVFNIRDLTRPGK